MSNIPRSAAYSQLWRIVDGAVVDALKNHEDYFTSKGRISVRPSVVKRVTGTVLGFAEQSAKGRVAAETATGDIRPRKPATGAATSVAEGGGKLRHPHCRVGKVRVKHKPGWTRHARRTIAAYLKTHAELASEIPGYSWPGRGR